VIAVDEAILQDQLFKARAAGKVCVHYPRGSDTILAVLFTATPPEVKAIPAGEESGFTSFTVMPSGNLLMLPDRPNCAGYVVLGAGLTPLS
jgi:hypothetical protein